MEKKTNTNILNEVILGEEIKALSKEEKGVVLDLANKYVIDKASGEVRPMTNGLDIQLVKNFLSKYCIFDSKVFEVISNNDFKKAIKVAMTECFKLKLKRVDKTSELNSYTSELANTSILAFTKALLKAFMNMFDLSIVKIDGAYRLIDTAKFNMIKLEAHKQMWEKIKLDCEL